MDTIKIRVGQERDIESLASFNMKMALETEEKQLVPEVVRRGVQRMLDNPRYGFYVVAEVEGAVVGSLMVTYEWSDWRDAIFWWIQSLYVVPEYRRRGIFTRLYEFVKQRAAQDGNVCGFRLYAEENNTTAHNTYESVGMKEAPYKIFEEEIVKPLINADKRR